jgi:hypothetical protein
MPNDFYSSRTTSHPPHWPQIITASCRSSHGFHWRKKAAGQSLETIIWAIRAQLPHKGSNTQIHSPIPAGPDWTHTHPPAHHASWYTSNTFSLYSYPIANQCTNYPHVSTDLLATKCITGGVWSPDHFGMLYTRSRSQKTWGGQLWAFLACCFAPSY